MFQTYSLPNEIYRFAYSMCRGRYKLHVRVVHFCEKVGRSLCDVIVTLIRQRKIGNIVFSEKAYISLQENGQESLLAKICHGGSNLDTAVSTIIHAF